MGASKAARLPAESAPIATTKVVGKSSLSAPVATTKVAAKSGQDAPLATSKVGSKAAMANRPALSAEETELGATAKGFSGRRSDGATAKGSAPTPKSGGGSSSSAQRKGDDRSSEQRENDRSGPGKKGGD